MWRMSWNKRGRLFLGIDRSGMMAAGVADLAEKFRGDTDITGDLLLGNTLGDLRIFIEELEVTFLGSL